MKKNQNFNNTFIAYCLYTSSTCILVYIPVEHRTILINAAFRSAALIRREPFIRGKRLCQCGCLKLQRLFEARRLLEEVRYV